MKRLICIITAAALCLCLAACSSKAVEVTKTTEPEPAKENAAPVAEADPVGMPNPMVDYPSLEELNELLGSRMVKPMVMGVTDETFCAIGEGTDAIGQYCFTLAGYSWTFRFSPSFTEDISGVYGENGTAFEGTSAGELQYGEAEGMLLARWATVDGQYVLMVEGSDYSAEQFASITEEIRSLTIPEESGEGLVGVPNPIVEYESLAELNEQLLGCSLAKPMAMGVSDETFCTIGEGENAIAQYCYSLAGYSWTFRFAASVTEDISGVYVENGTVFEGTSAGELQYGEAEGMLLARWATVDGQYVLTVEGSDYTAEDFAGIVAEVRSLTIPEES